MSLTWPLGGLWGMPAKPPAPTRTGSTGASGWMPDISKLLRTTPAFSSGATTIVSCVVALEATGDAQLGGGVRVCVGRGGCLLKDISVWISEREPVLWPQQHGTELLHAMPHAAPGLTDTTLQELMREQRTTSAPDSAPESAAPGALVPTRGRSWAIPQFTMAPEPCRCPGM